MGNSSESSGIGFMGLLTIVFITLKLTGFINWSWIWILSPIWVGWLLTLIAFIFIELIKWRINK